MVKKEISTVAQHHYARYASEFSEKETQGENSMPTPSPQGAHKGNIVQSSPEEFDAVAMARKKAYHIDIPYNIYQNTFRPNHHQWYQSYLDESRYYQMS